MIYEGIVSLRIPASAQYIIAGGRLEEIELLGSLWVEEFLAAGPRVNLC